MKFTLLTRKDCGLCDRAAALMREMGLEFASVDIDTEPALREAFDEAVPVVLAQGRELCRAPITRDSLRSALRTVNLGSGR